MRVLILSDIHSNYEALKAVVAAASSQGPIDATWCLGDVVGYGPDPGLCLERLREMGALIIAGNHDLAAIGQVALSDFNAHAAAACRWTETQLSESDRAMIAGWPATAMQGDFSLVHGTPRDPVWEYLLTVAVAEENLDLLATPCCLVGHTHLPAVFELIEGAGERRWRASRPVPGEATRLEGRRLFYNPGGVGQPRDGDPRAAYALYDTDDQTLTHHRVEYDIEGVQRRMAEAGLPLPLIARLARGR